MSSIKILQFNTNRNTTTTENALQLAIELDIQILAIQKPQAIEQASSYRSINYTSFKQVFLEYSIYRPRAIFYILKTYKVSLATISSKDLDYIIIDLIELNIQLVNIYNATHSNIPDSIPTIQRDNILSIRLARKAIILDDFNIYHPWQDPFRP